MNLKQAIDAAPPTPACFASREAWAGYLLTAQQCNKQQPFNNGIYRPQFGFCDDCTLAHSSLMARAGKCNPSMFRVTPAKKEAINEAM